jgi:hypothetical protein
MAAAISRERFGDAWATQVEAEFIVKPLYVIGRDA